MLGVDWLNPLYTVSGFGVGMLVGLTGVGGGSLMTPLLVLLFGIHPATAVGTDLLYAAVTKSVGTMMHGFSGTVDWRVVRRLATGSAPATIVTILALSVIGTDGENSARVITTLLGIAVLLTGAMIFLRPWLLVWLSPWIDPHGPRRAALWTILAGAVLGVLVSLSSVGAGALGVTFLFVLYPAMPTNRIVGSDIAHAVPLTLLAGLGHWWLGSINWHLLLSLLSGSIPGIIIGSLVAARVPEWFVPPGTGRRARGRGRTAGALAVGLQHLAGQIEAAADQHPRRPARRAAMPQARRRPSGQGARRRPTRPRSSSTGCARCWPGSATAHSVVA